MIADVLLRVFKNDTLIKRNLLKTITWGIVGSLDTVILCRVITGDFALATKIGLAEFLTKLLLYYLHERFWQHGTLGLPSKYKQAQMVQKEVKPNLFEHVGKISRGQREQLNNNPSFTLWLTGLSGSGKSTMAAEVEAWIHGKQGRVYILDGDNTRLGINSDLSFSDEDRAENIRRVAELCKLFNDAGVIVIASFISPFNDDRLLAKSIIGKDSFIEVFADASLTVCRQRDTKGLYKRALEGKIKNFTGITSPYEQPISPDIHLHTDKASVPECLALIQKYLLGNKLIRLEEELMIRR